MNNINLEEQSDDVIDVTTLDLSQLYELIKNLQNSNKILKEENKQLRKKRYDYLDIIAFDILEYFNDCKSIKKTAEKYDMTIKELIDCIPYWDGCSDGLQAAHDYNDFVKDDEDEDDKDDEDEDEDDKDLCEFCKDTNPEFRCTDCDSKICYPCRNRCDNCMKTICPNCDNEQELCSNCIY